MLIFLFPIGIILMWKYKKFNTPCRVILSILCFLFMLFFILGSDPNSSANSSSSSSSQKQSDSNDDSKDAKKQEKENSNIPDKIALMTYAQIVIEDYYPSPKFPASKDEYDVVSTGLRSKIEGKVSVDGTSEYQRFWVIIEFTDDTYKEYNLISLQIGNDVLYKK